MIKNYDWTTFECTFKFGETLLDKLDSQTIRSIIDWY